MMGYFSAWRALPRAQAVLLGLLGLAVAIANVGQPYPDVAPLHHVPTVLLVLAGPLMLRRWPLSTGSLGALVAFFLLHTLAGRYTYSNVPYDAWAIALTGHDVTGSFGLERNGFDRLVHLAFGLLWTLPFAEIVQRHGGLGRVASLSMAFLFVGAGSAAYEVFEWLLTMVVAPGMAESYNGQQGDMWDAQKDMALAMGGSLAACLWPRKRR